LSKLKGISRKGSRESHI